VGDLAVVAVGSQSRILDESNSVSENGEESPGMVRLVFAWQPGFITKINFFFVP
jgi:hypothetical protein